MPQPNILFILIDDMGWRDLRCYGSSFYETPNIDRLAAEGMLFTDAYAACPVCSPTRASLLSGKYPANVGVTDWIDWGKVIHPARGRLIDAPYIDHLPETETTVAAALREGGYQTWHVGKWHLGGPNHDPTSHGFDVNVAGCEWGAPGHGYFSPWKLPRYDDPAEEGIYLTDHLTDRAIELIDRRDAERPFFMHMSHYAVHTPIQAPAELIAKYEAKARRLKLDQIDPLVPGELHPGLHKKDKRVMRRIIQSHATYAAMVENLDTNIGRLLDALEAAGIADDTLVMFTSDNGGLSTSEGSPTCNLPLAEGKGWMYEGGTREPMLVRWPGSVRPSSVCHTPITSPDLYPTLIEAAGLPLRPQQHVDGHSFFDLIRGGERRERPEPLFWHYPHYGNQGGTPGSSIREGQWKLIEFFEDGRLELYNLREDLSETRNLATIEPQRTEAMHDTLVKWRESCEAKTPQINPDYHPPNDPLAAATV